MSSITHATGAVTIISDRPGRSMSGYAVLVGGFVLLVVAVYLGWASLGRGSSSGVLAILIFLLGVFVWKGLYVLQPNYRAGLQLFGSYIGTDATTGLSMATPSRSRPPSSGACRTRPRRCCRSRTTPPSARTEPPAPGGP